MTKFFFVDKIWKEFQRIVDLVEKEKSLLRMDLEGDKKLDAGQAQIEEERLNQRKELARQEANEQTDQIQKKKERDAYNRWTDDRCEMSSLVNDEINYRKKRRAYPYDRPNEDERQDELAHLEQEKILQELETKLESIERARNRIFSEHEAGEMQRGELAQSLEEKVCQEEKKTKKRSLFYPTIRMSSNPARAFLRKRGIHFRIRISGITSHQVKRICIELEMGRLERKAEEE